MGVVEDPADVGCGLALRDEGRAEQIGGTHAQMTLQRCSGTSRMTNTL